MTKVLPNFEAIRGRYDKFIEMIDDVSHVPIRVFDPLTKQQASEVLLIRELSKELQNAKERGIAEAAKAAEEAANSKETEKKEVTETEEAVQK